MPKKGEASYITSRNPKVRAMFRESRLKLNKTQKALAMDLGLKESYIRQVENGHINPSLKRILLFEQYFKVSGRELFPDLFDTKVVNN